MATQEQIFWQTSYQRLRPFILRRVKDPDVAQDLLQEVALRTHLHQAGVRQPEKMASWMYQVARNVVQDYFRQQNRDPDLPPPAMEGESELDLTTSLAAGIPMMIARLPEPYREAVKLVDLEGVSQKELADRLGISYSGAKSRVQRGRAMLREMLLACCDIQTDAYGNVIHYAPRSC